MTMAADHRFVDIGHVVDEVGDLLTILMRQAVACCIGYVYRCSAGGNNRFYYARQVLIIGTACIFGIKFNVIGKVPRPFNALCSTLKNVFAG